MCVLFWGTKRAWSGWIYLLYYKRRTGERNLRLCFSFVVALYSWKLYNEIGLQKSFCTRFYFDFSDNLQHAACGTRVVSHQLNQRRWPQTKIIGGSTTPYGAYPWQVIRNIRLALFTIYLQTYDQPNYDNRLPPWIVKYIWIVHYEIHARIF